MKNTVAILLIIAACHSAFGQDSLSLRKFDYAFTMYVGPQGINSKQLNQELALNGIDQLSKTATVVGAMHTLFRGRFGFGTSVDFLKIGSKSSQSRYAVMNGYNFGVHFSYYVIDRPSFTLYPMVEFRAATMFVKTIQRSSSSDINNILQQPHNDATIRYSSGMITLGFGFSSRTLIRNRPWLCPQADRYFSYDLKAGYNFTFDADHGRYNGTSISDGATLKYNGPYVKVGLGFGTRIRKMNWK